MGVTSIFVFIVLVFWIFNFYLTRTSSLDYKIWDVQTVTAADYTVEYIITADILRTYK